MTPQVKEKYEALQTVIELMIPAFQMYTLAELEELPAEAAIYADGSLDVILPHFMSIRDMHTSQKNLNKAIKICKMINELRKACQLDSETPHDR